MKKHILASLVVGLAATGAFAQGTIAVDNLNNGNTSATATTGGLFFQQNSLYNGATLNIEVLGGASATSLTPIVTLTGNTVAVNGGSAGVYADQNGLSYNVPGVASQGSAFLEVEAWEGNFSTLAAAQAGGAFFGTSGVFQNATGGPGNPPAPPVDLVGMPAVIMNTPEPSTLALGGLGAAALLLFRRRK